VHKICEKWSATVHETRRQVFVPENCVWPRFWHVNFLPNCELAKKEKEKREENRRRRRRRHKGIGE